MKNERNRDIHVGACASELELFRCGIAES